VGEVKLLGHRYEVPKGSHIQIVRHLLRLPAG
jgi:hypothetical protein